VIYQELADDSAVPPLHGRWLYVLRTLWIAFAILCCALIGAALPRALPAILDNPLLISTEFIRSNTLNPQPFGVYYLVLDLLLLGVYWIVAGLLFWRLSHERIALLASVMLITWGAAMTTDLFPLLSQSSPPFTPLIRLVSGVGNSSLVALICILPDGKFSPRWTAGIVFGYVLWTLSFNLLSWLHPITWIQPAQIAAHLLIYALLAAVQGIRFHSHLTPIQRQQAKWVLIGFVVSLVGYMLSEIPPILFPALKQPGLIAMFYHMTIRLLLLVLLGAFPITILFSIWRYQLWGVDVVISRSLIYTGLAALLGIVFVICALLIQFIVQSFGLTQQNGLAVTFAALLIGLLYHPTRRRLQKWVDRRVYHLRIDLERLADVHRSNRTPATSQGLYVGKQVGAYVLRELVGRGGMSEIYLAHQSGLDRPVAIKVLNPQLAQEKDLRERFELEAKTVARLRHPNIVSIFDYGHDNGVPYMVMEYIVGKSMTEHLKAAHRLTLSETCELVKAIADALDYAHEQGVIHRDVKPANVMLQRITGRYTYHAILTDFGITKIANLGTGLTDIGLIGTVEYMAPEQIHSAHSVDRRVDVYALGVTTYQMLTGELPFKDTGLGSLLFAHLHQPPPDVRLVAPHLAPHVSQTLQRAMAKSPHDRFPGAGAFAKALCAAAIR
jgi:tRNA A-37 threonylcarbamoyl transferase component Bud32